MMKRFQNLLSISICATSAWSGAALAAGWDAGECTGTLGQHTATSTSGGVIEGVIDVSVAGTGGGNKCPSLSAAWSGALTLLSGGRSVTCAGDGSGGAVSALMPRADGADGSEGENYGPSVGWCLEFTRSTMAGWCRLTGLGFRI